MFIKIPIAAEDTVGDSELQKLDQFYYRDLVNIGEIGAGRNFGNDTFSTADTGMLVKRALTSNETKVFSSGFIERFLIFWMKSVLYLTKDEVLPQ